MSVHTSVTVLCFGGLLRRPHSRRICCVRAHLRDGVTEAHERAAPLTPASGAGAAASAADAAPALARGDGRAHRPAAGEGGQARAHGDGAVHFAKYTKARIVGRAKPLLVLFTVPDARRSKTQHNFQRPSWSVAPSVPPPRPSDGRALCCRLPLRCGVPLRCGSVWAAARNGHCSGRRRCRSSAAAPHGTEVRPKAPAPARCAALPEFVRPSRILFGDSRALRRPQS